ncbi:MAG: DUF4395 domain-containing protein [Acidimicrobiales bacterium]
MSKLLGFPEQVNETSARLVAGGVAAMAVTAAVADQPWLMFPLAYGFASRVACGPKLSPLGLLATRVATPRLSVDHRFSPGPPKRFAQAIGLAVSLTALVLHYRRGKPGQAKLALGALGVAAGLEAGLGLCLGCKMFALGVKVGLAPQDLCEECSNIWSREPSPEVYPSKQLTFN